MAFVSTNTAEPESPAGVPEGIHEAAWHSLRGAYLLLTERFEAELAAAALPDLAWFDVLLAMDRSEALVRPKDLLCRVSVTKSGLTRLLDRIEKDGLIERRHCDADRRGVYLAVTDDGRQVLAKMKPVRDRVFAESFAGVLDEDDAAVLSDLLRRVRESVLEHRGAGAVAGH